MQQNLSDGDAKWKHTQAGYQATLQDITVWVWKCWGKAAILFSKLKIQLKSACFISLIQTDRLRWGSGWHEGAQLPPAAADCLGWAAGAHGAWGQGTLEEPWLFPEESGAPAPRSCLAPADPSQAGLVSMRGTGYECLHYLPWHRINWSMYMKWDEIMSSHSS